MLAKLFGLDLLELYVYPHKYEFNDWRDGNSNLPLDLSEKFYELAVRDLIVDEFLKRFDWIRYVDRYSVAIKFRLQHKYLPELINYCGHRGLFINFERPNLGKTTQNNFTTKAVSLDKNLDGLIIAKYSLEEYNEIISKRKLPIKVKTQKYNITIGNKHLFFVDNKNCVGCGLNGSVAILTKSPNQNVSLGIYGETEKKFIRMTIDHIIPKSKNGPSSHKNYQVLCQDCNTAKGNGELNASMISKILEGRK